MKKKFVAGLAFGLVLAVSPAFAAKKNYKATIEGGAVDSLGTGVGNFTFDDVTKRLCGKATYEELEGGPVTTAALKEADGFTIVKALTVSDSPIAIDVTLTDEQVTLLESGPIFIAIGNAMYGVAAGQTKNGEINGELVEDPAGEEQPCPGDTEVDSGAPPTGSSSGDTPPSGTPDPVPSSDSDAAAEAPKPDDGGCSTSGSSTGSFALVLAAVALLVAKRSRRR